MRTKNIIRSPIHDWARARNIPLKTVIGQLGISPPLFWGWAVGQSFPRPQELKLIAEITNGHVTAADMVAHFLEKQKEAA